MYPEIRTYRSAREAAAVLDLFFLGALATYGTAYMITALDGPFDVFARLRHKAGRQQTWIERGIHCVICVSFWVGIVVAVVLYGFTAMAGLSVFGYLGFSAIVTVVLNRLQVR